MGVMDFCTENDNLGIRRQPPLNHPSVLLADNSLPMIRVLLFSTLYPNQEHPNHGVFVENRIKQTLAQGGVEATALAPVPLFPFRSKVWGRYAAYARVPAVEQRAGLTVHHPRFAAIPRIGTRLTAQFLYSAALRRLRRMMAKGLTFDVIDAHYFYPDGVAAAMLARAVGKPFVITGRGSDLTLHTRDPVAKAQILNAAREANALITVSQSLKRTLVEFGIEPERVAVLRNGVETDLFRPLSRDECRVAFNTDRFCLVSVGGLIPRKGHAITIEAMTQLPDCELLIAGAGPLRAQLETQAKSLGVADRVRLLGEVAHRDLPKLYNAADAMVLMSSREGWANVILESLASGTPVLASDVGGANEIIRAPVAGALVPRRDASTLAQAVQTLRANPPNRAQTRTYAEAFGWAPVAAANKALLTAVAARTPNLIPASFSVEGGSV